MFYLNGYKINHRKGEKQNRCNFFEATPIIDKISCLFYNVFTKRNADNAYTKYNTENQMGKTNPNTS